MIGGSQFQLPFSKGAMAGKRGRLICFTHCVYCHMLYMFAISCTYTIHLHSLILSFTVTRLPIFSICHCFSTRYFEEV